ncbi:hypothetical protein BDW71DRAFT_212566 [Aspergillus fruticulosus]
MSTARATIISLVIVTIVLSSLLLVLPMSAHAAPLEGTIQARQNGDIEVQWTWLYSEGCSEEQQKAIKKAHQDALDMADHVKEIDFGNHPGAMNYFGPSTLNKDWHGSIQAVFNHISTFRGSDFWSGFRMNARCGSEKDKQGWAMLVTHENDTFSLNSASLSNEALTTSGNDGNDAYTLHDDDEVIMLEITDDTLVSATEYHRDFNTELFQWSACMRTPKPECAKTGDDAPSDWLSFTVDGPEMIALMDSRTS